MLVKELKELLENVPEGMPVEQFDNLTVMFSNDGSFYIPSVEPSGFMSFGGRCDAEGKATNEDDGLPDQLPFFCLVTENVFAEE